MRKFSVPAVCFFEWGEGWGGGRFCFLASEWLSTRLWTVTRCVGALVTKLGERRDRDRDRASPSGREGGGERQLMRLSALHKNNQIARPSLKELRYVRKESGGGMSVCVCV